MTPIEEVLEHDSELAKIIEFPRARRARGIRQRLGDLVRWWAQPAHSWDGADVTDFSGQHWHKAETARR